MILNSILLVSGTQCIIANGYSCCKLISKAVTKCKNSLNIILLVFSHTDIDLENFEKTKRYNYKYSMSKCVTCEKNIL